MKNFIENHKKGIGIFFYFYRSHLYGSLLFDYCS